MKKTLASTALLTLAAFAASGAIGETSDSFSGNVKDAWLTGRIESMYLFNEHLSPFAISTDVENGVVRLTGTVESEIDRDLAGALAENADGVVEVENELTVDSNAARSGAESESREGKRDFGSWVDDATTTAAVKTWLLRNGNTKGLQIDVDTLDDVVTLSGRVETAAEKDLAEQLAQGAKDVDEVRNNLVVDPS